MSPELLVPTMRGVPVHESVGIAKKRLLRDLGRLNRLRNLCASFRESLTPTGRERAHQLERTLVESLVESSAVFVRLCRRASIEGRETQN
jgi:hypothetical protein